MSEEEEHSKNNGVDVGLFVILGIIFFPASIIGACIYGLFRFLHQKISAILLYSLLLAIITAISWPMVDPLSKMFSVFNSETPIVAGLIPIYLYVCVLLGIIAGIFLVLNGIRRMKTQPYNREDPNSWMYHFEYRRTPWEISHHKKVIQGLKEGKFHSPEKAPIGLDEKKDQVISRYNSEAVKQSLIVGSAGSGKTITMLSMILNDIINHIPVIVIDFKRDPEIAAKMAAWSKEFGGNFQHFSNGDPENYDIPNSPGQVNYDPLSSGSPTAKADMVLRMREYDQASAVYRSNMQQLLITVFAMLDQADRSKAPHINWNGGGLFQLASAVSGGNLTELVSACEGKEVQKDAEDLDEKSHGRTQIAHAVEELQGQLRTVMASEYGRWLKYNPRGKNINLFQLSKTPGSVVLFSFDSDSEPEFTRYVGSLLMMDLTTMSALRRNHNIENQVNVYIDEFQAVNPESVEALLEKSRASKVAMTLAQQSFEQIVAASKQQGEAYLLSILDTCSNFFIHAGMTQDSAERIAKILGKEFQQTVRVSSKREDFMFSNNFDNRRNQTIQTSQEERWIVGPKEFMSLSAPTPGNGNRSTAIVVNKSCADKRYYDKDHPSIARKVWLIPDDRVLDHYYRPQYEGDVGTHTFQVPDPVPTVVRTSEYKNIDETDDGGFVFEDEEEADAPLPEPATTNDMDDLISSLPSPEPSSSPSRRVSSFNEILEREKSGSTSPDKEEDEEKGDDALPELF